MKKSLVLGDEGLVHPAPLFPLPLIPDPVLLLNSLIPIMATFEKPLGLFRRSTTPFKHLSLLSKPLVVILSKSGIMSFRG